MEYNNVINVDENDVKDVDEKVEPVVETVEESVVEKKKNNDGIDVMRILYSVAALVLGIYSTGSIFMLEYSFLLSTIATVASSVFAFKYLVEGYRSKTFNKLTFAGFLLGIIGLLLGVVRVALACVASVGTTFLKVLF